MCILRNTVGIAVVAILALAIAAPTAWGDPAGVTEEDGGSYCAAMLVDGHHIDGLCNVHAVGSVDISVEVFGNWVLVSSCESELEGSVDADGIGYIDAPVLSGGSCNVTPCAEEVGEAIPWPITFEESGSDRYAHIELCATTGMGNTTCEFDADVADSGALEVLTAPGVECDNAPTLEVDGEWELEEPDATHPELALQRVRPSGLFKPTEWNHSFNGAAGTSFRDVTFRNETGGGIELQRVAPVKNGSTGFTTNSPCEGAFLNSNDGCVIRVTKSALAAPGSVLLMWRPHPWTGPWVESERFAIFP